MTLANPFGPARPGGEAVLGALDYASSRRSDGKVVGFDEIARYTTTFRHESGEWKIVHRHADPISTEDDSGPLRTS